MFSKLKDFFCKTYPVFGYEFFIPVALYKRIEAVEGEVSPKSIRYFFSKTPYFLSKGQLQIIKEADKLFFVQMKKTKERLLRKKWSVIRKYFRFGQSFLIVFMGLLAGIKAMNSIIETLF